MGKTYHLALATEIYLSSIKFPVNPYSVLLLVFVSTNHAFSGLAMIGIHITHKTVNL